MQFTEQTITILNRYHGPEEIEVTVGEDTGLGYYETIEGITITTTNSGYAVAELQHYTSIFNTPFARSEKVAQKFIEIIAPLLDWKGSFNAIMEQARFCYGDTSAMRPHLRKAFNEACEQVMAEAKK